MKTDRQLIEEYLFEKLDKVMKKPYGNYKYPFVDPGSAYDGNLWDWDTFWAMYSMINVAENGNAPEDFREKLIDCGKGNVLNFLSFQLEDGYIRVKDLSDGTIGYVSLDYVMLKDTGNNYFEICTCNCTCTCSSCCPNK